MNVEQVPGLNEWMRDAAQPGVLPNYLYYGDNLEILREHIADESVDLIYLDPPFKSEQDYNVLFSEKDGGQAVSQLQAFEDTWSWNPEAARAYESVVESGFTKLSQAMQAFRKLLGEVDMMAYLSMMAPRLIELKRVLAPHGSIYLHCDPTAGHYLKLLMDAVFRPQNFRNEIIWYYYNKMHDRRKKLFPRAHDSILFYVKDMKENFTFHQLKEQRDKPVKQLLRKKVNGRMVNAKDESGHVMYRMKEDRTLDNVWRIPCLQPAAQERLGYQTQKPEALLKRIIEASSNPGDIVLDPFCGCGTSIAASHHLDRRWIGIDITQAAIVVIKQRFADFGALNCTVIGEPTSIPDAIELAKSDPYQFQWWSLGLVGARPVEEKKGADRGIDGRLLFHDNPARETKQIIFSVKAGALHATYVRDLRGVVEREKAEIGVLISIDSPTGPMRKEAASAGFYKSPTGKLYPRIQLLTVPELLSKTSSVDYPKDDLGRNTTFRKSPAKEVRKATQKSLFGD